MAKIEKLPSGNYRIRVIVGHTEDGKPIRKSFTHYDKTKLRRIAAEYADAHRNSNLSRFSEIRYLSVLPGVVSIFVSIFTLITPFILSEKSKKIKGAQKSAHTYK